MEVTRREFMARTMKAGSGLVFLVSFPRAISETRKPRKESRIEKKKIIRNIIAGIKSRKEQEAYLRKYLQNLKNIKIGRPGQKYIVATMRNGKPEIESYYLPQTMWCQFQWYVKNNIPSAIKYLKS